MARLPTTQAQVNGYKFLIRRLGHALVRHDVRMLHDPQRSHGRAMIVGIIIASLLAVACFVVSILRPAPQLGNSTIVISQETGAMYVNMGQTLNPVLNLASARLIVGSPQAPQSVQDASIRVAPRGPLIGIIGAPNAINYTQDPQNSWWSICDQQPIAHADNTDVGNTPTVTAIVGAPSFASHTAPLPSNQAVTVVTQDKSFYLINKNIKHRIDSKDTFLLVALKNGNYSIATRTISDALINSIQEGNPIKRQHFKGLGSPVRYDLDNATVGEVFTANTIDNKQEYYVAMQSGLLKISLFTATIIRATEREKGVVNVDAINSHVDFPTISSTVAHSLPMATGEDVLPVNDYPDVMPSWNPVDDPHKVLCQSWHRSSEEGADAQTITSIGGSLPLTNTQTPSPIVASRHDGQLVDQTYVPPVTGECVVATGLGAQSDQSGSEFYISDNGIRYSIGSPADANALGFSSNDQDQGHNCKKAPWEFLSHLPHGPVLSKENALVIHDSGYVDPKGQQTSPPEKK